MLLRIEPPTSRMPGEWSANTIPNPRSCDVYMGVVGAPEMVLTGLHPLHVTGEAVAKTRGFSKFAIYGETMPYLVYKQW